MIEERQRVTKLKTFVCDQIFSCSLKIQKNDLLFLSKYIPQIRPPNVKLGFVEAIKLCEEKEIMINDMKSVIR